MLRDDLLLGEREPEKASELLFVPRKRDEEKLRFYDVLAVGPKVKDVKVGDIAILPWTSATFPFEWNNRQCVVTEENNVVATLEK